MAKLQQWLGAQWATCLCSGQPLMFLEVYVGTGEASNAVKELGGSSIKLGLRYGQDFHNTADRVLSYFLVCMLVPIHRWVAVLHRTQPHNTAHNRTQTHTANRVL